MRVLAIDWSGAKHPHGKLWLAEVSAGALHRVILLHSREQAVEEICHVCNADPVTVVGLDFAFSFPAWFLKDTGVSTAFAFWELAEAQGEKWLSDCREPFWGRPGKHRPGLEEHFRNTEKAVQRTPGISPKSCFQIGGAGAVGTGSIRGMPFLRRLREAGMAIWPFDPPRFPLVVEIYPRILSGPVNKSSPSERERYLQRNWPDIPEEFRDMGIRSDDAFDAMVSALVMDRHRSELENIVSPVDGYAAIEGAIWTPRDTRAN
jgi:hypothetical protein